MASNDYDDLLESFMNNSQKVYNDDRNALEKSKGKLPSSYSVSSNGAKNQTARNRLNRAAVKMRLKLLRESFLAE